METGLLLLAYRYLDPATGRFLTRDPIGVDGGVNLYTYVGNGVVIKADPRGLLPEALCLAICAPLAEIYPQCVEVCKAAVEIKELNDILCRVIKQRGTCRSPKTMLDCYHCPGTGGVFEDQCVQCCGKVPGIETEEETTCQEAYHAWREAREGRGRAPGKSQRGKRHSGRG
ncbi:MAG: RHS repeat-associated core domain-containing protein [Chthonomonadetes bacterium]|nr:RHS repeat-associated core domain-containing protein [Chthonomonadetes bacterium]